MKLELTCQGVVQGLGVRPALYRLARELGLGGSLTNRREDLQLELWGSRAALEHFRQRMEGVLPEGVRLDPGEPRWSEEAAPQGDDGAGNGAAHGDASSALAIRADDDPCPPRSLLVGLTARGLAADRAPCQACRADLLDPSNRRWGDPFLSCCACGPRYTIATALPWQRAHTTLAPFPPCPACRAEFRDPANRRFHSETISCPRCGPRLTLLDARGQPLWSAPARPAPARASAGIAAAAALLERGGILALQGVGGFQLLVDATSAEAVARLRRRKRRPFRPLALLVADPAWLAEQVELSAAALALLSAPAAPIVLLPRRFPAPKPTEAGGTETLAGVAPGCPQLGVMLPATALHLLLVQQFGRPLVCTSGNTSGEPLCANPPEALERLQGLADAFLIHDRSVARPLDDSVAQLVEGERVLLRRARGLVPEPLLLPAVPAPRHRNSAAELQTGVVALGGDHKAAPALALGTQVWLAPHLGDLAERSVLERLRRGLEEWLAEEGHQLGAVAFDPHPGYLSHHLARSLPLAPHPVQHHLAHALAVVAERGLALPVLAFCADGLGYGDPLGSGDHLGCSEVPGGTRLWGGELLQIGPQGVERLGWLQPLVLPGGERAVREPRRSALGWLLAAGPWALEHPGAAACRAAFSEEEWRELNNARAQGFPWPTTTSVGRLFDGAASLLGLCQHNSCEGEAALRLQGAATAATAQGLAEITPDPQEPIAVQAAAAAATPALLPWTPLLRQLLDERAAGVEPAVSALAFHQRLAEAMAELLAGQARRRGLNAVVLAGGCFQNTLLLERLLGQLRRRGLTPHWAAAVPGNDGGLAVGQLWASHLRSSWQRACV